MTDTPSVFARRRTALLAHTGKLFVFTAHDAVQMNADQAYPFQQETHFFYLTGITEPGWILVVDDRGPSYEEFLIAPTISAAQQVFDGALAWDDATRVSGVVSIVAKDEGWDRLVSLGDSKVEVLTLGAHPYQKYFEFQVNPAQARVTRRLKKHFNEIGDYRPQLNKARALKSPEEIAAIRRAIAISEQGFEVVKRQLSGSEMKYEYDVEAILNAAFRKRGGQGHAYAPIVAAGAHACTLHYNENNGKLPENGLLLIDAGSKVDGYAADITRTYALGTPSAREQEIYKAVASTHTQIIALLRPGLKVGEYHDEVDRIMKQALESVGLLKSEGDYRKYFPHAISHGLGLDVHDSLGGPEVFLPGMVLTVEPGIYVPEEGIGVRIEDDILITEDGAENLSQGLSISL